MPRTHSATPVRPCEGPPGTLTLPQISAPPLCPTPLRRREVEEDVAGLCT